MLTDKIKADALQARKDKDRLKADLLTTVIATAQMSAKNDSNREMNESDLLKALKQFLKSVNENLKIAPAEQKEQYEIEKNIIESYLPSQLTEQELEKIISDSGLDNIGAVMKHLKENYEGRYDGSLAAKVTKSVLG